MQATVQEHLVELELDQKTKTRAQECHKYQSIVQMHQQYLYSNQSMERDFQVCRHNEQNVDNVSVAILKFR